MDDVTFRVTSHFFVVTSNAADALNFRYFSLKLHRFEMKADAVLEGINRRFGALQDRKDLIITSVSCP